MNKMFYKALVGNLEDVADFSVRDSDTGVLKEVGSVLGEDLIITVDKRTGFIKLRTGVGQKVCRAFDRESSLMYFLGDVAEQYAADAMRDEVKAMDSDVEHFQGIIESLERDKERLIEAIKVLVENSK